MKALKRLARDFLTRMQLPPLAKAVLCEDESRKFRPDPGPKRIIDEGIAWLGRAQDRSASHDGGLARHFSLINGWATSYPETTGYIVPTMIAYGQETGSKDAIARARAMLDWLVAI